MLEFTIFIIQAKSSPISSIFRRNSNHQQLEIKSGSCGTSAKWTFDTNTGLMNVFGSGDMSTTNFFSTYKTDLKAVIIEENIQSIGYRQFIDCSNLAAVTIKSKATSIGDDAFFSCASLYSIYIPDSLITIGNRAFLGCTSLVSLSIPYGVKTIGYDAFYKCSNLTSLVIPESVNSLGSRAFGVCSSLVSITIPSRVTSIESDTLYRCESLTSIVILGHLTSVGSRSFGFCPSLTSVTYFGISDPENSDPFWGSDKVKLIIVPFAYNSNTFCGRNVTKLLANTPKMIACQKSCKATAHIPFYQALRYEMCFFLMK